MRFGRFSGMICPWMAGSYDDARRVYTRNGIWMVEYLRARREVVDFTLPEYRRNSARRFLMFYRKNHFAEKETQTLRRT
jgi:hypothetical protein